MSRHKMVLNNLLKNSISAYYAAIEIHNKPNFAYRYETTTLLLMNAWELLLKAFIRKYVKGKSIFIKNGHTITIAEAINYVEGYINSNTPKAFTSIKENLLLIENYRNNIVHYYNEQIEPYIFMLLAKAALNYVEFIQRYFNMDVTAIDGLFILPLGFKLPFRPEEFLSTKSAQYESSPESRGLINEILNVTKNLEKQGIEDSVVLGFDIYLESVKKVKNSDLLVAITSEEEKADATFAKVRHIQVTDDPSAEKVFLTDDELIHEYPLRYKDVCQKCRSVIPNFKQNHFFNEIMADIKKNPRFAFTRKLYPNSSNSSVQTTLYSENVIEEILKRYKSK